MISLVPVATEHSDFIKELAGDESNAEFFRGYPPLVVWPENVFGWFKAGYLIRELSTEKYVGIVSVNNIDNHSKQLEFGIVISALLCDNRHEIMLVALEQFINYAFDYLQFNKIYCKVFPHRKTLIRVMEAHNFKLDGVIRQNVFFNGAYQDECLYSVLGKEF